MSFTQCRICGEFHSILQHGINERGYVGNLLAYFEGGFEIVQRNRDQAMRQRRLGEVRRLQGLNRRKLRRWVRHWSSFSEITL